MVRSNPAFIRQDAIVARSIFQKLGVQRVAGLHRRPGCGQSSDSGDSAQLERVRGHVSMSGREVIGEKLLVISD